MSVVTMNLLTKDKALKLLLTGRHYKSSNSLDSKYLPSKKEADNIQILSMLIISDLDQHMSHPQLTTFNKKSLCKWLNICASKTLAFTCNYTHFYDRFWALGTKRVLKATQPIRDSDLVLTTRWHPLQFTKVSTP